MKLSIITSETLFYLIYARPRALVWTREQSQPFGDPGNMG
jgi:hypothetical protein